MIKNDFTRVITALRNQFNILAPIDISPYFYDNGEFWLQKLIKEHYQEVFHDNYRIVLYFNKDEHLYGDKPGRLITTLQKHISEVDISNFFVVLITADEKIANDVHVVNKMYSTDDIPITVHLVNDVVCEYTPQERKHISTVCVHPWFQLHIGTGGDVLPCCDSVHSLPLGNIKDNTIIDIVNSDKFNSIREKMISGERPIECSTCYDVEDVGMESKRNRMNKKYSNDYKFIIDNGNEPMNIRRLDVNLGSTCNFKCRMCTGFSSSRLRAEEKKINTHGDLKYQVISQSQVDTRMPELLSFVETTDSISFAGGESLLIPEYNRILEKLIKLKRTDTKITYSSNLSILPKKAMKYWKEFSNITVIASIDSDGEHAEYYRHGTSWDDIVQNYMNLSNNYKNIRLMIRSTLSIYNAFRLIKFQNTWISKGLINPDNIKINIIEYPDYLSVQVLPSFYRNQLNGLIDEHIEFLNCYNSHTLIQQWQRIQQFLVADKSFKLDKFFKYTDKLDTYRDENFEFSHPEYINLRQHIGDICQI